MSGRFLLDTNVIIALFGGEAAVQKELGQAEEVFVPSIVLGELYFSARKSGRVEADLARVEEFALISPVLVCDAETAKEFGAVKNELRQKGRPIPDNDLWIAAIARQYELTLAIRDIHFEEIGDLQVAVW